MERDRRMERDMDGTEGESGEREGWMGQMERGRKMDGEKNDRTRWVNEKKEKYRMGTDRWRDSERKTDG